MFTENVYEETTKSKSRNQGLLVHIELVNAQQAILMEGMFANKGNRCSTVVVEWYLESFLIL